MEPPSPVPSTPLRPEERDAVAETMSMISSSWEALLDAFDGIPDDRIAEPGVTGHWSAKDLLGHIAYWDDVTATRAHRQAAGEPDGEPDWRAVNDAVAAANAARPLPEIRDAFFSSHARMLAVLETLPPLDPRRQAVCQFVRDDTCGHYDEHAAELRAWRARVGV